MPRNTDPLKWSYFFPIWHISLGDRWIVDRKFQPCSPLATFSSQVELLKFSIAAWQFGCRKKFKYWGLTCIGIFWEQIISSKKGSPAISKSKNLKKRSDGKQRLENFRIVQHANSGCYDSEHQVTDSVSFILIVTGRSVFGAFVFFFSQIFRFWVCVWLSCLW